MKSEENALALEYENLQYKSIELQIEQVKILLAEIRKNIDKQATSPALPEWVTLKQAADAKGGCAWATVKARWWLQPCCGANAERIGGRKCWARADVVEWLGITDDRLSEYAKKFGIEIPKQ